MPEKRREQETQGEKQPNVKREGQQAGQREDSKREQGKDRRDESPGRERDK